MLSRRMPFKSVPCSIWLPQWGAEDDYGNRNPTYGTEPDIETRCCYAPGDRTQDTDDDIEDGRPYGDVLVVDFFLPKEVDADLRQAIIACHPANDSLMNGRTFRVVGQPLSYSRENTPGDYSWRVRGVEHLG